MAQTSSLSVPKTWPGGFGAYEYSKRAVQRNLSTLLTLLACTIVVTILGGIMNASIHGSANALVNVITDIITYILAIAQVITLLTSARGKAITPQEALSKVTLPMLIWFAVSSILTAIIAVVSLLCLIVPFFFVAPRLYLAQYFIIDKKMDAVQALQASWKTTGGSAGKVWGIWGTYLVMALPIVTIIGIPFSIYFLFMYQAVSAVLYVFLTKRA